MLFDCAAGYGLGGSTVAMFGRVGGGIYTKAADALDRCSRLFQKALYNYWFILKYSNIMHYNYVIYGIFSIFYEYSSIDLKSISFIGAREHETAEAWLFVSFAVTCMAQAIAHNWGWCGCWPLRQGAAVEFIVLIRQKRFHLCIHIQNTYTYRHTDIQTYSHTDIDSR